MSDEYDTLDERERLTQVFAAADEAIDAGFEVMPAAVWPKPDGTLAKAPLLPNGHLGSHCDHQLIRQQLISPPHVPPSVPVGFEVVVGMVPGSGRSGVLDCDAKAGKAGLESLRDLMDVHGMFVTSAWRSPSGGTNVLFAKPNGASFGNHSPWPGIDVRADGGWVVAPGNTCCGGSWAWATGSYGTASPLPQALTDQLKAPSPGGRRATNAETVALIEASPLDSTPASREALARELERLSSAAAGSRHDALLRIVSWAFGMHALDLRWAVVEIKAEWQRLTAGEGREDEVDEIACWVAGREIDKRAAEASESTGTDPPDEPPEELPPPTNPMAVARILLRGYLHDDPAALTLRHWRGGWMRWHGPAWREIEERTIRAEVYRRVEHAQYWHATTKEIELRDWAPNRRKLGDLLEALAALTHLPQSVQPPAWLDSAGQTTGIVACTNGILDVTTRTLYACTPAYFNEIAVPFDYDADSLEPTEWLDFLDQLWPNDRESVALLQEWFGYVLSGATNLQKILGIIGPIRSGKGTICRVLKGLVGERNVSAPTLSSFGQNFGLYDLIGKSVAIIGDVRLGSGEQHAVVERLLSISGEDTITLDRKYRDPWTGQLPTRIMFVSNELPRFGDASGAVATRCLVLETRESWIGREDKNLTARLLAELPAILNWSLEGLHALSQRGRFNEPQSSLDTVAALADLVSPVSAFVRDRCERGDLHEVEIKRLYQAWKEWADENGQRAGSAQTFGRNLRAVIPGIRICSSPAWSG